MMLSFGSPAQAEEVGFWRWAFSFKRYKEVAKVENKVYLEECGSCHFAYQPGLLPEESWRKLLDAKALADHFGENAELDDSTRQQLLNELAGSSADKSRYKRSKKIMSSLGDDPAPVRITKVPYFVDKHDDIGDEYVKNNSKVKSLSYCDKCHQKAKDAVFDDDTVYIPGKGYWTW
ncbi:MAG: diheme cytochrome c [Gammaproteobacteria bacterium]|nr:diheme cytochrome c [Gammaproteobacteria bacterium]